jgi:glycosyltransferase involved in cell wall biosynthesis
MKFSVLIPAYKSKKYIKLSIDSIIKQNYKNFEIIIGDDNPIDELDEIIYLRKLVNSYKNYKIKLVKNNKNLGVCKNLHNLFKYANGEIIFLMADDDILKKKVFINYNKIFCQNLNVGLITRPYFWFFNDIKNVVREIKPFKNFNYICNIRTNWNIFFKAFETSGQISGLAFRRKAIKVFPHTNHIFTTHIYTFAQIARDNDICFYKHQNVAVRIEKSQTRHLTKIYNISPTSTWIKMYKKVFNNNSQLYKWGLKHICSTNHVGLLQIKNYSTYKVLIFEIFILIKHWPKNIFNVFFWLIVIYCAVVPKKISRKVVDWTKQNILSKSIGIKNFV